MGAVEYSASAMALSTPEILESILVQLDLRSLLTSAQRVCRSWTTLVRESPSLQNALFFAPVKGGEPHILNPLLAEEFPSFFPVHTSPSSDGFTFQTLTMVQTPERKPAFLRKEASWRRMLVRQPPAFSAILNRVNHGQMGDRRHNYVIREKKKDPSEEEDGLRMETLFEVLLFHESITFQPFTSTRMIWAGAPHYLPSSKKRFLPGSSQGSDQNTSEDWDLVVYNRKIMQCRIDMYAKETTEEALRNEIATIYKAATG